ncbi:hypothetical protein KY348_07265 [Candidatus Woesearchaeota archaeon]|nr:hypothetical protein [Candidatus Woesearchaeota archaeon]
MHHKMYHKKITGKSKLRKTLFGILLFILLFINITTSMASNELDNVPGWKYWSAYIGKLPDILFRWQDTGTAEANAGDIYGWYNDTSIADIALWELIFCASDIEPEVTSVSSSSSDGEPNPIYVTTTTITALTSDFNESEFLYEVSWYIQPLTYDTNYRAYLLEKSGAKFYLPNNNEKWVDTSALSGSSDYIAFYSQKNYTHAVLNYSEGDVYKTFKVSVVEKKEE